MTKTKEELAYREGENKLKSEAYLKLKMQFDDTELELQDKSDKLKDMYLRVEELETENNNLDIEVKELMIKETQLASVREQNHVLEE